MNTQPHRRLAFATGLSLIAALAAKPVSASLSHTHPAVRARAASAPRLEPLYDATLLYTLALAGRAPIEITVFAEAGGQHLRVQGEALPVELLIDRPLGLAHLLLPAAGAYGDAPIGDTDPARSLLRGARFVAHGNGSRLGLACTLWSALSSHGSAEACVTSHGIILEARATSKSHGTVTLTARRVTEAPIKREMFTVPKTYSFTGAFPVPSFDPGQ